MKNNKLTPSQIRMKKVLKPIVEGILKEATFNEQEFKIELENASKSLWKGYNDLEIALRYLQTTGQGGTTGAFKKKIKMMELQSILENLDTYIDSK